MEGHLPINHTPHAVIIFVLTENKPACSITLPRKEPVLRLANAEQVTLQPIIATADGSYAIPVVTPPCYTDLSPEGAAGCGASIVVSTVVAEWLVAHPEAAPQVREIYVPDTGPQGVVRDDKGVIIGTRRLIKYK